MNRNPTMNCARAAGRVASRIWSWRVLTLTIWLSMTVGGFVYLHVHGSTAGTSGEPPRHWPPDVPIGRQRDAKSLLMFAHPRCPCTRASLRELAVIIASRPDLDTARVVFFRPSPIEDGWSESKIVQQAREMTGVDVVWDDAGRLAVLFGARTSGHVVLYDETGELAFSGGITAFRGHEGWNAGRAAVVALERGEPAATARTPVFGCPLVLPVSRPNRNCGERP